MSASTYKLEVARGEGDDWRACRRVTVGISVGAHYHEGAKFQATMKWVAENFDSCTVLICDSLHRFNEQDYYSGAHEAALRKSILSGTEWLERNRASISSCPIPCVVTRWEEWRLHLDFPKVREQICGVYDQDPWMQAAVTLSVDRYVSNSLRRGEVPDVSIEARSEASRLYIIEELAGLTLCARAHGTLEIYAGSKIPALDYLKEKKRADLPEPLLEIRSLKVILKACVVP